MGDKIEKSSIKQPFWAMSVEDVEKALFTSHAGISEEEANSRLKLFGTNTIEDGKNSSALNLFFSQFKSPLIFILLIAGAITIFLKDYIDSFVIFSAVAVNVALGFYQENKAENVLELLKSYVQTRARVRRLDAGGQNSEEIVDAINLVPGDVVRISQGDKIPADGRIIFVNNFEVDEAVLTGESTPVEKKTESVEADKSLSDRTSMVFGSTLAVGGFADVIITSTGADTEFGKIAALLSEKKKTKTPLQMAISNFAFWTGLILLVLTVFLFGLGIYLGYGLLDMFLIAVAVAVSAVPEGLPIALTIILAVGVEQLAKKKGVVRKLLAAETLGSTSLILTDKTGTLTQSKMELTAVIPHKDQSTEAVDQILKKGLLTTDILIENPEEDPKDWRLFGNFMEVAMVYGARNRNILLADILKSFNVVDRLVFNSDRKFSAAVYENNGVYNIVLLGAPEILAGFTNLSESEKTEVVESINERAFSGERILGLISGQIRPDYGGLRNFKPEGLKFDGLITFKDPLRPGVFESMQRISDAGVKTIIVTGDHKGTAEAVARELGLIDGKGVVFTGNEISSLSDEELNSRADEVRVYARVTPEQKVKLAKLYQKRGEIVAMTGDGINDAPALDAADIGIALGSGTDVTKNAADLVILDNNYETIVAAIEHGRRILDNIKKVIAYLLSNSLNELFLLGGAMFAGLALPLTATQILFVNFFTDSFPAIAFAFDKGVDELGHRPRKLSKNIFDRRMRFLLLTIGVVTSGFLFWLYWMMLKLDLSQELVRTFIFTVFATYTLLISFSLRSLHKSIFSYNPLSNIYLLGGVGVGFLLTIFAVYNPFMQRILGTQSLPTVWLLGVLGVGILNILAIEMGKFIYNKIYGDN